MANLEKIIKVTQEQYDVLASGGRVGDYVGLQDDYIYMIEDNNTYLPITGGTITGNLTVNGNTTLDNLTVNDNTTFKKNTTYASDKGIIFTHDVSGELLTTSSINADNYSGEIIYVSDNFQNKPLFANDSGAIIYSEDGDYHESITFNTDSLVIARYTGTQNYLINISSHDGKIYYYNGVGGYVYTLPTNSGTLALTSDIPSISLTTTTGSESITVGNDTLNVVTRDTAQAIAGDKTYKGKVYFQTANGTEINSYIDKSSKYDMAIHSSYLLYYGNCIRPENGASLGLSNRVWSNAYVKYYYIGANGYVEPVQDNNTRLGHATRRFTNVYTQKIGNQNQTYSLLIPDTTNWTADKTLATTDEIPQVKRYI